MIGILYNCALHSFIFKLGKAIFHSFFCTRNRLIKELQDEIEMETYNNEQKIFLEEEQMRRRKFQLERTWYRIHDREKVFMDYALKCTEEEEVSILFTM